MDAPSPSPESLIGTLGWKQFLAEKQELIAEYQLALRRADSRPMRTEPGTAAEAVFRRWLARFLPGRYGVTSGFVISPGLSDARPLRHYDVIVYDKINSPVLWRVGDPDRSEQGVSLALPVEFVHAVFEVKATLNGQSVRDAADKLDELAPLLSGTDDGETGYPLYLPERFACGTVFFRTTGQARGRHLTPLAHLATRLGRGFMGGIILSEQAEPDDDQAAQLVLLSIGGTPPEDPSELNRRVVDRQRVTSALVPIPGGYLTVSPEWSANAFALFAHTLVSTLAGRFNVRYPPSPHGMSFPSTRADHGTRFPLDAQDEAAERARRRRRGPRHGGSTG